MQMQLAEEYTPLIGLDVTGRATRLSCDCLRRHDRDCAQRDQFDL